MEQLEVYNHMLEAKDDIEYDQIYQRWLKERFTGEWWTWDRRYKESKL
jgi:dual specificity phosphatase 12